MQANANPSPAREAIRDAFKRALTHQLFTPDYEPLSCMKQQVAYAMRQAMNESQVWSQFECAPQTPERRQIANFLRVNAEAWLNGSDEIVVPAWE